MAAVNKEALFKPRLSEETFEIEGLGEVRIRSLSRSEMLKIRNKRQEGALEVVEMERLLLSTALVEPALTEDEVRQWQDASAAGELEPITRAIMRISGLEDAAPKDAVKRFPS
jgi:phosphoribosylformylglycinamidine (FGAM) synthase-like enzyme